MCCSVLQCVAVICFNFLLQCVAGILSSISFNFAISALISALLFVLEAVYTCIYTHIYLYVYTKKDCTHTFDIIEHSTY